MSPRRHGPCGCSLGKTRSLSLSRSVLRCERGRRFPCDLSEFGNSAEIRQISFPLRWSDSRVGSNWGFEIGHAGGCVAMSVTTVGVVAARDRRVLGGAIDTSDLPEHDAELTSALWAEENATSWPRYVDFFGPVVAISGLRGHGQFS